MVVPGDETWDIVRQAWNLAADQQPAAIALPETAQDVVAGRELRAPPTGCGWPARAPGTAPAPIQSLEGTVLVKTCRMRAVEIDAAGRSARAEAGAIWTDVTEPAAEHGLVALHGSSPTWAWSATRSAAAWAGSPAATASRPTA